VGRLSPSASSRAGKRKGLKRIGSYVYAAIVTLAAYLVRGASGFGSALLATPLLAMIFPLSTVVPALLLLDTLGAFVQGWRHRKHAVWAEFTRLLAFSLIGLALGVFLLSNLQGVLLRRALGVFIAAYAVLALLDLSPRRGGPGMAAPLSLLGGLVDGVFGIGGPFYVIYLRLRRIDKTAFIATISALFAVLDILRIGGYSLMGLYGKPPLLLALTLLPAALLGLLAGHRVHLRLPPQAFGKLVNLLLLASGVALLWRA
jgi:uncharacterized protein